MKALHIIAFILLVVGGLNWALFGIWGTDIGAWVGGMDSAVARTIYIIVGVAAIFEIVTHSGNCRRCKSEAQTVAAPQM